MWWEGKSLIRISKISRGRVRIVQCISWRRSLGREQLTTVKLCMCLSFPPHRLCCFYSLVLVLVSGAYPFSFGITKARNPSPNQKHRLPLRHHDGANLAQTTCIANCLYLRCPDKGLHICACRHLELSCPICVMREYVFLYVLLGAGC